MVPDRSRLGYFSGAFLLSAGVILLCLFPATWFAAAAIPLVSAAVSLVFSVQKKRTRPKGSPKDASGAFLAGAGTVLLCTALPTDGLPALLTLGFVPVITGILHSILRKEPFFAARGLCLAGTAAGTALMLIFAGFSGTGLLAAGLFSLAGILSPDKNAPAVKVLPLFSFAGLLAGSFTAAFLLKSRFPAVVGTRAALIGPLLIGVGSALCREMPVGKEDAVWVRAAAPFLPLLFFAPLRNSDPALLAAFLIPAGGSLFSRLVHAPVRYQTGEERQLLADRVPVSFYNGVLCLRHPLRRFTSAAGVLFILLNSNRGRDRRYHAGIDTVRHEYGHMLQVKALGPFRFWRYIAVPSMRGYCKKVPYAEYYNQPWERGADALGGVSRSAHTEESLEKWESYFLRALPKRKRAQYIKERSNENDQVSE